MNRRGEGGWDVKQALIRIFPTLLCLIVSFNSSLFFESEAKRAREREDLAGMSQIPSETTRLCVALLSLPSWESAGTPFVVVFYCFRFFLF